MKLEQLKDECPKMPEKIRAMVEFEVDAQIHGEQKKSICQNKDYPGRRLSGQKVL